MLQLVHTNKYIEKSQKSVIVISQSVYLFTFISFSLAKFIIF
jgi:hypothetical protein